MTDDILSPVDHYYIVYDAYCALLDLPGINNNHPMARHFSVLLALATLADPNYNRLGRRPGWDEE